MIEDLQIGSVDIGWLRFGKGRTRNRSGVTLVVTT